MSAPPDAPDVRDGKSKTALDASADPAATTGASVTKSNESAAGSSALGTSAPAPVELDAYGKQKKVHDLTYPPWPAVPAGVTITPFSAFRERGIKRHCGGIEADEVDANGVPTVALSSAHEDDECKTDSRFRNFTSAKPKAPKRMEVKANWWETWEEVEGTMRPTRNYNHMLPDDMVIQLVQEFIEVHKRWWPSPGSGPTDPRALFDDFQRFIGTMDQSTAPPNAAADSDDDEDDAPMEIVDGEGAPFVPPSTMDVVNDDSFGPANPKLDAFLADPALVVRRFLSSHARERGHIYHERNLLGLPRIIEFFLSFVTRSGIIKDAKLKKGFADALAVAKKAVIEIPKTSQVARAMPDTVFSKGCQSLWGRKTNAFHFADDLWTPSAHGPVPEARITEIVEPSEALPVLNGRVDPNAVIREEVEAGRLSFVNPEDEQVPPSADAFDGGGWGGTNGGWGAPGGDTSGGWGEGEGASGWGGAGAWDDEDVPMADIPLAPPAHEALLALPGLAPLRTTHTWGIVEHSMRRVKGVFAPSPPQAGQPDVEPARAVENALGGIFARVVLEPWPDFHEGVDLELNRPSILEASRGPVVEEGGDGKGHDPLKKEISVLVDVDMKDKIEVGMGVAGTWVQVVRDVKEGTEPQETGGKKKKTKKADYWYMDDLVMTIPSFYTG